MQSLLRVARVLELTQAALPAEQVLVTILPQALTGVACSRY